MTSYVVLLHRADVLPPCLSSRSSAARAVTALGAGTTQLKIEQLRHRQLPPAAAIGYLLLPSTPFCDRHARQCGARRVE